MNWKRRSSSSLSSPSTLRMYDDNHKDTGIGVLSGVTTCFDELMHRETLPVWSL